MALPDLKEWRVEALRVTLFGTEPFAPTGENWWKIVTGTDPEAAVNKPQSGEYSESGTFLNGQLELKTAFNRTDWILSFPINPAIKYTKSCRVGDTWMPEIRTDSLGV